MRFALVTAREDLFNRPGSPLVFDLLKLRNGITADLMPEARRQGLARRITESLYAWAWEKGARFAYLQVVATNAAAMPLYAGQGFRTVYEYEYLVPPTP